MIGQVQYEKTLQELRPKLREGMEVEAVLEFLKGRGFSQIACIRAVGDLGICPATEAKRLVHHSRAWSSMRAQNEALQEGLAKELRKDI
ncbi:hypothetical protein [Streptomyces sp. Ag109_G2-15]|uniref:hypothetical protein n=1 Tax=Streptomyces sp. Ag109_G2-15 TaxID=1938850 RepID=UPI00117C8A70|nr:hypothetical protein [Streptomyces sp. Ag109_G2-15]